MKKAISFSLVLATIVLPCFSVFAQKSGRASNDAAIKEAKTTSRSTLSIGNVFERVSAVTSGEEVLIRWSMKSETGNIGFYIHRIDHNGDHVINNNIVFGSAATAGRFPLYLEQYAFVDGFGGLGSVYYIELLDLDGKRMYSRSTSAQFVDQVVLPSPDTPSNIKTDQPVPAIELQNPIVPEKLASIIDQKVLPPDPSKHQWVVSRPGVRIGVNADGIYRVAFAQLESAGFNTDSLSSLWQLYRNGIEQAIIVNETEGYIEFYGRGIDTPESDTQGYFLINGDTAGKRIENMVNRPSTSSITLPSYNQTSTYKERNQFFDTVLNGPAENYWGRNIDANGTNISFELSGIDLSVPTTTLEVKAQGFSIGNHNIRVTLNGELLSPVTGVAQFPFSGKQTIPTSLLRDASLGQGPNVLNLASVGPSGDFNFFDSFNLTFARKHLANQDTLKAYTVGNKKTRLSGFSSANVRVFDITFENDPRLITNLSFHDVGGTFGTDLPSVRDRLIFALEDSKILTPVSVTPNDGELLGVSTQGGDLIIIAHRDFLTKAEAWAEYRRAQDFSVKVVDVGEVFNEFSYGVANSDSIKSFLEYAYGNWQVQPKYVLLIGDATRDPRNYNNGGAFNLVPTRMVTTIFTETGSDDALADFDHDGLAELAMGRIPARNTGQIDIIFNKVSNWEKNLGTNPLNRGAAFAVDAFDVNNNIDFAAITDRIKAELPAGTATTVVNRTQLNAQTDLIAAINSGKYIVNYTGHGSSGVWGASNFFWLGNVTSLTNKNSESIMTMLTCLNGYFLFPNSNGLGEVLLDHTNGGSVASWASTGLTSADIQETMAKRFYNKIGEGSIPRLGDLIKDAKTATPERSDVRFSWALLGDPMLMVR